MTHLFVGWDVGAWNCDGGKSQDALSVLTGTSMGDLHLVAAPWRANLRAALVTRPCPEAILSVVEGLGRREDAEVVVAADTPLGWPSAFTSLLAGSMTVEQVTETVIENPYTFRFAEQHLVALGLFPKGRTPLSAVRDMIGSQSSKGLYVLRKGQMRQESPAVWESTGYTVIETYPTPVRTSQALQDHFDRLRSTPTFARRARGKNVTSDLEDSLWCALVAALWKLDRPLLSPPPADSRIANEGWIWIPKDCTCPVDDPPENGEVFS